MHNQRTLTAMIAGDGVDYSQILITEQARLRWGELGKPGIVRACIGLPMPDFVRMLEEYHNRTIHRPQAG